MIYCYFNIDGSINKCDIQYQANDKGKNQAKNTGDCSKRTSCKLIYPDEAYNKSNNRNTNTDKPNYSIDIGPAGKRKKTG